MNTYMNLILEQRFFRLLSEYSQRKVSASEFTEAIEELATQSYRVRFEQEKNALFAFN